MIQSVKSLTSEREGFQPPAVTLAGILTQEKSPQPQAHSSEEDWFKTALQWHSVYTLIKYGQVAPRWLRTPTSSTLSLLTTTTWVAQEPRMQEVFPSSHLRGEAFPGFCQGRCTCHRTQWIRECRDTGSKSSKSSVRAWGPPGHWPEINWSECGLKFHPLHILGIFNEASTLPMKYALTCQSMDAWVYRYTSKKSFGGTRRCKDHPLQHPNFFLWHTHLVKQN